MYQLFGLHFLHSQVANDLAIGPSEIPKAIAEKTGFTNKDIKLIVEWFLQEVKNSLVEDKALEIRGFGTFKVKNYKARIARNPKSGEEVIVPARKKAAFKVSRELNKLL